MVGGRPRLPSRLGLLFGIGFLAAAVLGLRSDEAAYVTGAVLDVAGGL